MERKDNRDDSNSIANEKVVQEKERTGKKRMHHIQSRYMQSASSSAKKCIPSNDTSAIVAPGSVDKKRPPTVRKTLFKGLPVTPVRSFDVTAMKMKKPQVSIVNSGPLLAVPAGNVAAENHETLHSSLEQELLISHFVASEYLCLKNCASLNQLGSDAPRKLSALVDINKKLVQRRSALEVEAYRISFMRCFREHLSTQKELQQKLTDQLASHCEKAVALSGGLDGCLHYLLIRNIHLPCAIEVLRQELKKLTVLLESSLSKSSSFQHFLEELASEMFGLTVTVQKQMQSISGLKEILEDMKDISGVLTFHLVKQLESTFLNSGKELCFTDYMDC